MTYRPEQARLRAHRLAFALLILTAAANYSGGRGMHASLLPALALPPLPVPATQAPDPLPSWNEGASKKAIADFVSRVTRQGGPDFVPPAERIATFDNDGTLWSEQPVYFQVAFALDRVKALAPQHPEWKTTQPFKGVLEGDMKAVAASGERGLIGDHGRHTRRATRPTSLRRS